MSVPRCCFAARPGRPPLACPLGLLLAVAAVLLLPVLALAFVPSDNGGCLCQSPQPLGDSLTVVAFLDASHSWALAGGSLLPSTGCRSERATSSGLIPQSFARIVALVGRPPPAQ